MSEGLSFETIEKELDIEFFLDRESIPYKVTRGVNGEQLNIQTCPNPACQDNRWRTYFGTETGRGNCFVCGRGFNKLGFIHDYYQHSNWRDTFQEVRVIMQEQGWRPIRKSTVAVTNGAIDLPTSIALPTETGQNLVYLESRGFGPDLVAYFKLRFCEFGWWKFRDSDGSLKMQDFKNRVIIPVYDLDGELKTFQGRDITNTSDRKYLFPKELPGTGRYLLNGQNVIMTSEAVMGEGIFDVMAIKKAFDEESDLRAIVPIGSFGKHLSYGAQDGNDQLGRFIALKARGLQILTIMWDGESKALVSALNAAKLLTGIGLKVRIALLPAGKDPNEVLPEVVREAYRKAQLWTPALDVRYRLRNPYADAEKVSV